MPTPEEIAIARAFQDGTLPEFLSRGVADMGSTLPLQTAPATLGTTLPIQPALGPLQKALQRDIEGIGQDPVQASLARDIEAIPASAAQAVVEESIARGPLVPRSAEAPPIAHFEQPEPVPGTPEATARAAGAPGSGQVDPRSLVPFAGSAQARVRGPRTMMVGSGELEPRSQVIREAQPGDPELAAQTKERTEGIIENLQFDPVREAEIQQQLMLRRGIAEQVQADTNQLFEEEQLRRKRELEEKRAAFQTKSQEVAGQKIDANRYMKNRSTGETIMQAIGMALSTLGQAFNPNIGNTSRDMMMQAIDADIQAQIEDARNSKDGLAREGTLLAMAQDLHTSEELQALAAKQLALQAIDQEFAAFEKNLRTPEAIQAMAVQRAEIQNKAADIQQVRERGNQNEVTTQKVLDPRRAITVGGPAGGGTLSKAQTAQAKRDELLVIMPNGDRFLAVSPKDAKEARQALQSNQDESNIQAELESANSEFGSGFMVGGAAKRAEAATQRAKTATAKAIAGQGLATTESDVKQAGSLVPEATALFDIGGFEAQMKAWRRNSQLRLDNALRNRLRGFKKGQPVQGLKEN